MHHLLKLTAKDLQNVGLETLPVHKNGQHWQISLPILKGRRKKSIALKHRVQARPQSERFADRYEIYLDVPPNATHKEIQHFLKTHEQWLLDGYLRLHLALRSHESNPQMDDDSDMDSEQTMDFFGQHRLAPNGQHVDKFAQQVAHKVSQLPLGHLDWLGEPVGIRWVRDAVMAPSTTIFNDPFHRSNLNHVLDAKASSVFMGYLHGLQLEGLLTPEEAQAWSSERHRLCVQIEMQALTESLFDHQPVPKVMAIRVWRKQGNTMCVLDFSEDLEKLKLASWLAWQWLFQWALGMVYRNLLIDYLPQNLPMHSTKMSVKYTCVQVRQYKSRWGSCKADRSLQFNWRILQAPKSVVEYLFIHELSHLKHPNHSKAFWSMVAQFCPEYPCAEAQLKQRGHKWISFLGLVY